MRPPNPPAENQYLERRHFLAVSASIGSVLLAGCSTETGTPNPDRPSTAPDGSTDPSGDTGTTSGGAAAASGRFRLLISDQPVAIDEFDELNVVLDRARVFRTEGDNQAEGEETATRSSATPVNGTATETEPPTTETTTDTATASPAESATATETEEREDVPDDGDPGGFFVIDLDGATVDLTRVVGDKAIRVFDGELPEGRYTKIELHAADVEGIVDGNPVRVNIPSGKLQIVKPFDVIAGETLSFVFDINVVRKGRTGEYNLLPVISESGVAGEEIEVREVSKEGSDSDGEEGADPDGEETERTETEESEDEARRGGGRGGGPPDEATGAS